MSIEVQETWRSRKQERSQNASTEREYVVKGTDDEDAAGTALAAHVAGEATLTIGGDTPVTISKISIDERLTEDAWLGTVQWGRGTYNVSEPGQQTISFDTTGGRAKVTQSLGTNAYSNGTAPNFNGAIGVTKSGIEGAEVITPALSFSIKRQFAPEAVTQAYINTLADLTGKYNNNTFMGRAEGEVRFDGATGDQQQVGQPVDITFKFTISPNVENLTVAGIEGISKKGWQYLWVLYEEVDDTSAKFLCQRALAVYVEDLPNCTPADLSGIGLAI